MSLMALPMEQGSADSQMRGFPATPPRCSGTTPRSGPRWRISCPEGVTTTGSGSSERHRPARLGERQQRGDRPPARAARGAPRTTRGRGSELPGALGARIIAARLEGAVLAAELEHTLCPHSRRWPRVSAWYPARSARSSTGPHCHRASARSWRWWSLTSPTRRSRASCS